MKWKVVLLGMMVWALGFSAQANLVENGGFELGSAQWERWNGENIEEAAWDWSYSGSAMVRMWTDAGLYQDFSVTPGARYQVLAQTCHTEWDPILWGTTGRVAAVTLEWRSASDELIGTPWRYTFGTHNQKQGEGTWVLVDSGPQRAPQNAVVGRVLLQIWNDGAGSGSAFFDDVQVLEVKP